MQVTKEGDYALRAVIYLASATGRTASANEISAAQKIPPKFLARIMPKLVRQGLISSTPGSKGGYKLAREASQLSFLQVLEAIEGPLRLNVCLEADYGDCEHETLCSMKSVWSEAQERLAHYFAAITFDQLTEPPCSHKTA